MMIPSHRNRCWDSRLANFFIAGGAITLTGAIAISGTGTFAQITADPSLGTVVAPNGTTFEITGGTTVGDAGDANLFHSFSSFSIPNDGIADFFTAP